METHQITHNPRLANICRLSLNISWILFFLTLTWIAVADGIHSDEVVVCLLIVLPVAFAFLFCIHVITLLTLIIRCEHLFNSAEIIYFVLSDIFFLLLIGFVCQFMNDPNLAI